MSLNDLPSSSFQSRSPRLDLNRSFVTPSVTQLIFTSSQSGQYMESVDRTATLDPTVDIPDHFSEPPAPTPQDRLDRLSALFGMRDILVNPSFELPLFVQAARGPLLPLLHIFSESVLTELLDKFWISILHPIPPPPFHLFALAFGMFFPPLTLLRLQHH